jgi:hypothetical protein
LPPWQPRQWQETQLGVDTELSITAESRIREILERSEEGIGPSLRADAIKIPRLTRIRRHSDDTSIRRGPVRSCTKRFVAPDYIGVLSQ